MSDELQFLAAVRARPYSRDVRLVYSDWLTERGDPRGEFVRLQCRAMRTPRGSARRREAEAAVTDLLLRHEEGWLGPLLGHAGNWEWRGGRPGTWPNSPPARRWGT